MTGSTVQTVHTVHQLSVALDELDGPAGTHFRSEP
jgi:hypothetical protein